MTDETSTTHTRVQAFPTKEEFEEVRIDVVPANEENLDRLGAIVSGIAP